MSQLADSHQHAASAPNLAQNNLLVPVDIPEWLGPQDNADNAANLDGLAGPIYKSVVEALIVFARSSQAAGNPSWHRAKVEVERLVLWGVDVAATDNRLDEVLSQSVELQKAVIFALLELGNIIKVDVLPQTSSSIDRAATTGTTQEDLIVLLERAWSIVDSERSREVISFSDDISAPRDDDQLLEDIAIYVDCLMDVSQALQAISAETEWSDVPRQPGGERFNVVSPEAQIFCRKIRDRFPMAPKYLVERLGQANALRSQMLRRAQSEADIRNKSLPEPVTSAHTKSEQPTRTSTRGTETRSSNQSASLWDKSTAHTNAQIRSRASDTQSIATFSNFSVSMKNSSFGRTHPRVPPLPSPSIAKDDAGSESLITCPLCHQKLSSTLSRTSWK
jgi:hypothetical protein